jgi:hypothetical protein
VWRARSARRSSGVTIALEVNPLLVDGTRIEVLDAVVTWKEHG